MSGRNTHVPTMMPRTNWITSSGFMLAYPGYVLLLMPRQTRALWTGAADMKFFFFHRPSKPAPCQNLDFFRRFRIQIARTAWKQGTAEIDREILRLSYRICSFHFERVAHGSAFRPSPWPPISNHQPSIAKVGCQRSLANDQSHGK